MDGVRIMAGALFFLASLLGATEITLKSGAVFSGQIVSQTDNFIVLESEGSRINVARSLIARIDGVAYTQKPAASPEGTAPGPVSTAGTRVSQGSGYRFIPGAEVDITLTNGTQFHGRITSENENFIVLTVGNSRVNIAKAVIDEVDGKKIASARAPAAAQAPPAGQPAVPAQAMPPVRTAPAAQSRAAPPAAPTPSAAPPPGPALPAAPARTAPSPAVKPIPSPPEVTAREVRGAGRENAGADAGKAQAPRAIVLQPPPDTVRTPQVAFARPDTTGREIAPQRTSAPSEVKIIDRRYDDSAATLQASPAAKASVDNADTSLGVLVERLRSRVPDRRMAAVVMLGLLGPKAASTADVLVGLLTDTSVYRSSGSEQSPVLKGLPSPTSISDQAARALVRIGPPAARAVLRVLRDPNWVIRAQAAFVLGEMRNSDLARPLLDALKDTSLVVCDIAVDALVKLKDPRPLFGALHSRDAEQKKYAIEALARMKDPQSVDPLIRVLSDRDSYVREKAAYALGEIRDPRAIDALCAALADNISFVRANAVEALGKIGDPRVMGRLNAVLKDPSNYVQEKALAVAKQFAAVEFRRYKQNTALLVAALQDPSAETREKAAQTLWLVTGKDFGADHAKWQAWLSSGAAASDSLTRRK